MSFKPDLVHTLEIQLGQLSIDNQKAPLKELTAIPATLIRENFENFKVSENPKQIKLSKEFLDNCVIVEVVEKWRKPTSKEFNFQNDFELMKI
ncbi:MAG: hypothetical protein BGO10_05405 [Chlamydia sp. 32-24]|nr:MAG: hypothetical protein BGO10_05405 [Chlamydia sp. 32-24]